MISQPATQAKVSAEVTGTGDEPSEEATVQGDPDTSAYEVDYRHGKHELPRKFHQLIGSQARHSASYPNEEQDQQHEFAEEPNRPGNDAQHR